MKNELKPSYRYFLENYYLIDDKAPDFKEYELDWVDECQKMMDKGYKLESRWFRKTGYQFVWIK